MLVEAALRSCTATTLLGSIVHLLSFFAAILCRGRFDRKLGAVLRFRLTHGRCIGMWTYLIHILFIHFQILLCLDGKTWMVELLTRVLIISTLNDPIKRGSLVKVLRQIALVLLCHLLIAS